MGVDPAELGAEAQNIWSMLDDMSQNDPEAYREFIANQVTDESKAARKKFTPTPGFVVKYHTVQGSTKQKLFMNCCSHGCVAIPKNPNNGKDVPNDTRMVPSTSNLEIPLAIGELRSLANQDETSQVVDAVFHPWVLERAQWDAKFKADAMQLASTWVEKEKGITLIPPGKVIKSLYKGGTGSGANVIAHDFIVADEAGSDKDNNASPKRKAAAATAGQATPPIKPSPPSVLQTPTDVLRGLGPLSNQDAVDNNDDEQANFSMKLPSVPAVKKKPLIEIVGEPSPSTNIPTSSINSKGRTKKVAPVVQKGFLNKATKAPLYPSGSSEGHPSSAYVNLLHRSKVVDMNNMPPPAPTQSYHQPANVSKKPARENEVVDVEFDQLCLEAEPELLDRSQADANPFLNEQLTNFLMGKI
ncbi:hypothetical protein DYB35_001149 [Aphanomyces astaci]|uniref:PIH1 N-terminal domain-containing protein n=1 Tax=Aphanomyces astaci TaxID=112090 RepID=A0A3R6XVQ4_APHAT|nr:hypothetical protein DYB35_001149 [Aphanomyces astaci]